LLWAGSQPYAWIFATAGNFTLVVYLHTGCWWLPTRLVQVLALQVVLDLACKVDCH
jgi:predicted TIM-barrel fold metal-dependent hydrolase